MERFAVTDIVWIVETAGLVFWGENVRVVEEFSVNSTRRSLKESKLQLACSELFLCLKLNRVLHLEMNMFIGVICPGLIFTLVFISAINKCGVLLETNLI